jgi:PAS domain S-box-containing protein
MLQGRPPRVLIVEDERIVARDIQQTLAAQGYDAYAIASSAEEAIAHATENRPDVALLDIRIKGDRDGIETAEVLGTRFDVPVVYLTAYADDATIERAKQSSTHGYLQKPVKSSELRGAIEICLYKHGMQRQLRERERWFSTTLRSIADGVVSVDTAGKVSFMNPTAEHLLGSKAGDAVGQPIQQVMRLHDENRGIALEETPLDHALRDRRKIEVKDMAIIDLANGNMRCSISDSAAPVVDDERLLGAVMVFRDVTEQKQIRKQLEMADRLASLGTMAAGVAHEINNPLSVVVASSAFVADELERLRRDMDAPGIQARQRDVLRLREMSEALNDVQAAATRIGRIVGDLRAFARPPSPASTFADVVAAVEWSVRVTSHEIRQRARIQTKLESVPFVEADEAKLVQVFVNLLMNAAHAIPAGAVESNEISVTARFAGERVIVEVSDTGAGIPDEIRRRIFEPFFTTKPWGAGTGLGLSICHGIVTAIGGTIEVESAPGRGTRVRISLPAAPVHRQAVAPPPPRLRWTRRRHRLLVVDDEPAVLRSIARGLREHEVLVVGDGQEALKRIEGGSFDLILVDLMMPTMTGMEFYERIKAERPDLAPRVMFLTAAVSPAIVAFLESVPNPHLQKPFDIGSLRRVVEDLLRENEARDDA